MIKEEPSNEGCICHRKARVVIAHGHRACHPNPVP
jgi:hypothetical protein